MTNALDLVDEGLTFCTHVVCTVYSMTYCTMFKEDDVFKETFMVNDLSTYIYIY